jgi:hypothetical protein
MPRAAEQSAGESGMNSAQLFRGPRVALQSYGVTGLSLRAKYEMRRRLGLYQASPRVAHVQSDSPILDSPFDVDLERVGAVVDRDEAIARADRVADGWHHAYRSEWRRRPISPDEWSIHPTLGTRYPAEPWWELRRFLSLDPVHGDVKDIWEPARFTWVFDLALGYAASRDERYAEAFWSGVDSFVEGNPPFRGVQWSCGQETSVRALSCLWGERVFASSHAASSERRARLVDLFAWSGERVADAIEYAISQRNNHGVSEATGLAALGHRLLGLHPDADRWVRDGAKWLEYLVMDQFAEDGWYVQHSFTYLRMALDQLVVAQRVMTRAMRRGLSNAAMARVRAAIALLVELHDPETGDVPNHGANDGSTVLPITTRPYRDFRPSITAAAATFGAQLPRNFGASLEALTWIGAADIGRREDPAESRVIAGSSGWISARRGRTRVFARAGDYQSNPSHIDPCHVDIWFDGEMRTVDAGTYRYTAPPPWRNGLAVIAVHNTVDIPSMPAAVKGSRFLWLERPSAEATRIDPAADVTLLELQNHTWDGRGVTHLRRCTLSTDAVDIHDEIDVGTHAPLEVRVHWLVPDDAPLPAVSSDGGGRLLVVRAAPDSVEGWWSPHYGERRPAHSVTFVTTITSRQTIHSRFVATNLRTKP